MEHGVRGPKANAALRVRIQELEKDIELKKVALDEILFINSHQLRKPMTNILGLIELIDDCENEMNCIRSVVRMLKSSVHELDVITRKISEVK